MTICILTLIQPSYFDQCLQPRGLHQGGLMQPPWILVFSAEFFGEIIHWYVFGVKPQGIQW